MTAPLNISFPPYNSAHVPLSPREQKLHKAAAEFESQLLSSLWKSMKHSFAEDNDDSLDPTGSSLEDWGIDAISGAVSRAGGIGIGKLIIKDLTAKLGGEKAASGAEKL